MKKYSTLTLTFLLIAVSNISAFCQSTLGVTYGELKEFYNSKPEYTGWADDKANDGIPFVSYEDKVEGILITSYFNKQGIVEQYRIAGEAKEWANTWGQFADNHYAKQGHGVWIDYAKGTKWFLRIRDNGIASFSCIKLDE